MREKKIKDKLFEFCQTVSGFPLIFEQKIFHMFLLVDIRIRNVQIAMRIKTYLCCLVFFVCFMRLIFALSNFKVSLYATLRFRSLLQ